MVSPEVQPGRLTALLDDFLNSFKLRHPGVSHQAQNDGFRRVEKCSHLLCSVVSVEPVDIVPAGAAVHYEVYGVAELEEVLAGEEDTHVGLHPAHHHALNLKYEIASSGQSETVMY